MAKISTDFIISQYISGIESYADFTIEVGLWESEKYVFEKYLNPSDHILDLGCGTGRTTFPLYKSGYQNIIGVDLTPEMISKAKALNQHFTTEIPFETGDATNLRFSDTSFDAVIFSFNGLMSIPGLPARKKAVNHIFRVLKPFGIFLFTTHDRKMEPEFFDFWAAEKKVWEKGAQNPELYEFGDIITGSRNESREIYIHIPDKKEILTLMHDSGFEVIETFYRSEKFTESKSVKEKSGECRFWVTKKFVNILS